MASDLGFDRGCAVLPDYDTSNPFVTASSEPDWFAAALRRPYDVGEVAVANTPIRYLAWGNPGGPATVLIHGGAAHAMWWAPLAAQLAPSSYVVAMDLSGHGLSGHRDRYSLDLWIEEIMAVARHVSAEPATVIGHSLGGIVASYVAVRHGDELAQTIFVDAPVWPNAPLPEQSLQPKEIRPPRMYASPQEARKRFRLVPPQDCANDWYVDHIAWHSMHGSEAGWRWRFDPQAFLDTARERRMAYFKGRVHDTRCPYALVMGARSYLADDAATAFRDTPDAPLSFIPDAAHHVMLDQPLALLSELQRVHRGPH